MANLDQGLESPVNSPRPSGDSEDAVLVGRETLVGVGGAIGDVTVQVASRRVVSPTPGGQHEPSDKRVIQLRVDLRAQNAAPTILSIESGGTRQLAAALVAAANLADDLG